MIKQTQQPPRDTIPEPMLAHYRLDDSPRRREAGSLLFAATAPDRSAVSVQASADPVTSRRTRARFRRLARARAGIAHPALLAVREIGETDGRVFVATEPFPARSLADLLRDGPLEPTFALKLLEAVADGLDAAHAEGVVHRTLSADSVLFDGEGLRLDLFGVFTVAGQASWGDVVRRDAHLHYEAPEGVRGDELVAASNVYSLTGLLFHALTGEQPFANHDPVMITYAHLSKEPPKPSERKPELPAGLDAIVARGMAKDPAQRPESAGALIAAAATVLRAASTTIPAPVSPPPAPAATSASAPTSAPAPTSASAPTSPAAARATAAAAAATAAAAAAATAGEAQAAPAAAPKATASAPTAAPAEPTAPDLAPTPKPAPRPAARTAHMPVAAEPPQARTPLSTWLVQLGPVLLVLVVAAAFGALLGTPGSGPEQAANTVSSSQQGAVQRLDAVRFRLRDELAFAGTVEGQADAARRLATAYGRAADHVTSPALVSTAKEASLAYLALESAARAGDRDAYDSARTRVEAAEKQVERELAQINPSRTPG